MYDSQSPTLVKKEWQTAEETSSGGPARDLHAPIRSARWHTAHEAVDPFASPLWPQ